MAKGKLTAIFFYICFAQETSSMFKLQFKLLIISMAWMLQWTLADGQNYSTSDYINMYSDLAVKEMKRTGIPASITLAQGILESGNGNSTLARKSNNHFGIKCHNDWTGKRVYHDDDRKGECFRKYPKVYDSYIDHSNFLVEKSRYASLFELKPTDYKGWAKGLKKAGYATDPHYAHRLIGIIEENNLQRFDDPKYVPKNRPVIKGNDATEESGSQRTYNSGGDDNFTVNVFNNHAVKANNGVKYIRVQTGDSFVDICQEFGLKEWEIYSYNDISKGSDITKYNYLYIQPKRNKANRKHRTHKVKEGETMHYISQKYGVKIRRLYRYNHMDATENVKQGQIIYLRKEKK